MIGGRSDIGRVRLLQVCIQARAGDDLVERWQMPR